MPEDIKTAAKNYATAKHGELNADNEKVFTNTYEDFINGIAWKDKEFKPKILLFKQALLSVLEETRDIDMPPGARLYNIAKNVTEARQKID